MVQSITPENQSQQQDAERFIQSALDALSAHVALLDENAIIIGVNTAWRHYAEANGFTSADYGLGMNYLDVCDQAARLNSREGALVGQGIREVMSRKIQEFYLEYPCHSPYEKRWYVVRVTRFEWYSKTRYIVAHQNVTELKHIQLELEESQKRLQVILDTVVSGIITLNAQSVIQTVNPAATEIFAYSAAEMIGASFDQFLNEPCALDCLQTAVHYELTGKRKDGSTVPILFGMNAVQIDERPIYTVVIQDISERKRLEQEMMEKEKLTVALEKEREMREFKSRFLSMMSHELRTPLTSIRLSYDMLTTYAEATPEEERPQLLLNISNQVDYLTDLVKDVMTISKAEIHQLEFMPELKDLITYCRDVVETFQLTHYKTHRVIFNSNAATIEAMLDKKLMRQVLTNLLSNAIKYSPEGGTVTFELLYLDAQAQIKVTDEGIGIPLEDQQKLFEPFQRASNVGNLPGTGLGLAIARQAVELHHGSLSMTSTPGEGTTFTLCLPVVRATLLTEIEDDWE